MAQDKDCPHPAHRDQFAFQDGCLQIICSVRTTLEGAGPYQCRALWGKKSLRYYLTCGDLGRA
jgi:hypothetical protein